MNKSVIFLILWIYLSSHVYAEIPPPPPPPPAIGGVNGGSTSSDDPNVDNDFPLDGQSDADFPADSDPTIDPNSIDVTTILFKIDQITKNQEELILKLTDVEASLKTMQDNTNNAIKSFSDAITEINKRVPDFTRFSPANNKKIWLIPLAILTMIVVTFIVLHKRKNKKDKVVDSSKSYSQIPQRPAANNTRMTANPRPAINPRLANYIVNSLRNGYNEVQIKSTLLNQGWRAEDIAAALQSIYAQKYRND